MIKFIAPESRIIRSPRVKVTDREQDVLNLLIEDPGYKQQVLAEKSGLSRKTVAALLKSLKEKELIIRIGSDRKGYWKINE